jgi:proline iminopeptidase
LVNPAPIDEIVYPPIEPYHTGYLPVSGGHEIYYEEVGNPEGLPVVYLHGGPGGGLVPFGRRLFDPEKFRVVLFDQRGAGKSRPFGSIVDNTTQDLISDMERLREHLGIESWLIYGGSWGTTLGLAYAQTHPTPTSALILRGIFLVRKSELRWMLQEGASHVFPEAWHEFVSLVPQEERSDLLRAYHKRIFSEDEEVARAAVLAWSTWEEKVTRLIPRPERVDELSNERWDQAVGAARMESHYYINDCFLEEGALLENAWRIAHIPCTLIQGRYDMVCPTTAAWELAHKLPNSELVIVPDAGHAASEPGIARAIIAATNNYVG